MKRYPKLPLELDVAVTGKCNLRCKHCLAMETWNSGHQEEFTTEELFKLFDELRECKIFGIILMGGELFIRPDILKILDKIKDFPFKTTILTNGTLINKEVIKTLKRIKYLKTVQVSLDGSTPDMHDWQRGKGNFDKTLKGIELLRKGKISYSLKAIINRYNFSDIENMVYLARDLGLKAMAFGDAVECGEAHLHKEDFKLTAEFYQAAVVKIAELRKRYPDFNFSGTLAQMLGFIEKFKKEGPNNGAMGSIGICGAGYRMLSIRADGWVTPCSALWTYKIGNIREESLMDIWNKSPLLNKMRELQDIPLDSFDKCRKCQFITHCNGGCRASGYYANNGDLKGLDIVKCGVYSTDFLQKILSQI